MNANEKLAALNYEKNAEIEQLRAEVERLRSAFIHLGNGTWNVGASNRGLTFREYARAVLTGTEPKP